MAQEIVDQTPINLQIIDKEGWTTLASQSLIHSFGIEEDDLVGIGKHNFFEDKHLQEAGIAKAVKTAFKGERSVLPLVEIAPSENTGEMERNLFRIETFPIETDETITHVGIVYEDISDKILLQRDLITKNAELETFVYTVSHDLKSPLAVISGCAEHLVNTRNDEKLFNKQIDMILRNTAKMRDFVDSILSLSRAGRYSDEAEDHQSPVLILVKGIVSDLKATYEDEPIQVEIGELPKVSLHPDDVTHVFQNLIFNAYKYRSPGRPLELKIDCREISNYYRFSVGDNGRGIDVAELDRIFDVFYRGKNVHEDSESQEGTGIGLSIVRKAVQKVGGKVWVESAPGEGSTFYFTLPR